MRDALPILIGRIVLAVCGVIAACAPDPRFERQAAALDVGGEWIWVPSEGRPPVHVTIASERSKNDVQVTITDRFIGPDEAALIERLVDDPARAAAAVSVTLGAGPDLLLDEVEGGENVSFDDGASTTIQVVGPALVATADGADDAIVRWSLRLDGDGAELVGDMFVTVSEQRRVVDDSDGRAQRSFRVTVPMLLVPDGL